MALFKLSIKKGELSSYNLEVMGGQKFKNDCIHQESEKYFLFLDGVIFNKTSLLKKYGLSDWERCVKTLYETNGEDFFRQFRGTYNGVLLDKRKCEWLVFSNFQGEKPIYICEKSERIIISSRVGLIRDELSKFNDDLSISVEGAYMLLSHGYMLENHTLFNEVERLRSGFYYKIESDNKYDVKYYIPKNVVKNNHKENEIIKNIDLLFNKAVEQQFEKDREYGYKHIVNLSGGLDSRMVSWCANQLGYSNQLNVTFAQAGSGDELIARRVAQALKNTWLFKSLNYGDYLNLLDSVTKITEGNHTYHGLAHGYSLGLLLNTKGFGIKHTGQLGDVILGWKSNKYYSPKLKQGAHSKKITDKLRNDVIDLSKYQNDEQYMILNRYINGTNFGSISGSGDTESFSPFYEKDFWNYCLTIPLKYRYKHYIYKKWIIEKYPKAARFKWDKTNVPVDYKFWRDGFLFYQGKKISVNELIGKVYRKIARNFGFKYTPPLNAMNPYSSWYKMNGKLRDFIKNYFFDHRELLDFDSGLKKDAETLYKRGDVKEKLMVLSLLSAIKVMTK